MPLPAARQLVAVNPRFTPVRFGLTSVADFPVLDDDPHWRNGIEFMPDDCAEAEVTIDKCPGTPTTKSPNVTGVGVLGAAPFTVYAWIACNPVGHSRTEMEGRTLAALANGEERAVERTFWTGVADTGTIFPHLAHDAVVVTGGAQVQSAASVIVTGAVDVVEGIGLLEGALGECYGGEGVIHVPRRALAHLAAWHLIQEDGGRLRTIGGTKIAAYSSGNRQGPTGVDPAAGITWAYATGAVSIRRSAPTPTSAYVEAIDRRENSLVYIAERTYVINWDCCHLALQLNLGGIVSGAVNAAN